MICRHLLLCAYFYIQAHLLGIFDNTKNVGFHEQDYDRIISIISSEGETIPVSPYFFIFLPTGTMTLLFVVARDYFILGASIVFRLNFLMILNILIERYTKTLCKK